MTTTPKAIKGTAIQTPGGDLENHTLVLRQLKEVAEVGQRVRGDPLDSFVRVSELARLGIIRLVGSTIQAPTTTTSGGGGGVSPTRNINTVNSLQGGGDLSADRTLSLVGDTASPGNGMLYGTNGAGTRGWYAQPTGAGNSLATEILADSPVGFWKCDDASGGFLDYSGNGYHMSTITGTITQQYSPLVQGLPNSLFGMIGPTSLLSGINSASITSQLGLTYPLLNWTVEAVIWPLSSNCRIFEMRPGASSTVAAILYYAGSSSGFQTFYPSTTNILTVNWQYANRGLHVACRCSTAAGTSTISYYINGVLAGSITAAQSATTGTMTAAIGQTGGNTTGPFIVGYVAFYNTALSPARIATRASILGKLGD